MDLAAYLRRVGSASRPEPTIDGLRSLQRAHASTIPFENLDIHLGRPIRLDLSWLQEKMVAGRRGGYCFEQNHLFMAALREVGFDVTPLAAWVGSTPESRSGLRTHMLLRLDVEGSPWIADVGFGADGFVEPIPLATGEGSEQDGRRYRLEREPQGRWLLRRLRAGEWRDLYAFTLEPASRAEYVLGNHVTSTSPSSPFVRTVTAQRAGGLARPVLRGNVLTEALPDGDRIVATIDSDARLLEVLAERFDLSFPAGTRFPAAFGRRD